MKKIIVLLLTTAMMMLPSGVFSQETKGTDSEAKQIVEMLTYISRPEKKELTRAIFSRMICEITDSEQPITSAVVFDDVETGSEYSGYIQKLYETGVIAGDGSGNFYPEEKIKAVEAYSMLLKVLGYKELIKDARPETIISVAGGAGLTKNIGLSAEEQVDEESAYKMIYNLLFADIMEYVYEDGGKYQKGEEYSEEVLKIYSANGILEAAEGYSLYDEKCGENNVMIGGKTFVGNGRVSADYIGMYGKYWYKDNRGDNEICGFLPKNNSTLKIMAEDISSYSDNVYKYYENDKLKTAKLSNGKDVIYNREQKNDERNMKPKYGYCMLTDNNDDGVYDVVMIYEYKNVLVSYVNISKESIRYGVSTNNGTANKEFILDKDYEIYSDKGKKLELKDVAANSLLTMMESENKIKIYQNTKTISGTITAIEEEYISVEGNKYKLAEDVYKEGWNGNEFTNVTIYPDIFGNIAAVKKSTNGGKWQFAYIIKRAYEPNKSVIQFKLLCSDGKVKVYNTATSKFKIDDAAVSMTQATAEAIGEEQVIRFKTNNDGEITAIDTADVLSSFEFQNVGGTDGNSLLCRADGKLLYKSRINYFKKEFQSDAMTVEGEAFVDKNTIMFNVPATVDSKTEDSDYYLSDGLRENQKDRIVSYNTDPGKIASEVIVVYNSTAGKTGKTSRTMLIKSVSKALHNDEEIAVLNGLYNGAETSLKVSTDLSDTASKLKEGDYVRLGVHNELVKDIEILYTSDGKGELNKNYYFGSSASYGTTWRYVIGNVAAAEDEKIAVTFNNGSSDIKEFIRIEEFNIYVYDPNLPKNKCIHVGTIGDITDMRSDNTNYDTVIIGSREHENHDMLIIKKKI